MGRYASRLHRKHSTSATSRATWTTCSPNGRSFKLVWHDEFDGDKLDESKWDVPNNRRRDGWWSPKAVSVNDGHLAISTLKDRDRYLDACVRTRGKFEHAHGYYVARIKLQEQPGHWSAFWLYNSSVGKVGDGGRDGTEIEIVNTVTPSVN